MKKEKKSNWMLIGAFLFFITSAGFTTANISPSIASGQCNVCAADGCDNAQGDQIGSTDCDDSGGDCNLTGGYLCVEKD